MRSGAGRSVGRFLLLLGLAVSPTFAQDQWIYAYFTSASDNRIVRFRLAQPTVQPVILSGLARNTIHDGARMACGRGNGRSPVTPQTLLVLPPAAYLIHHAPVVGRQTA